MRSRESQLLDEHWKKQYELQRVKESWLDERVKAACPKWPVDLKLKFEYNTSYDFWRANYGTVRDKIRAYELLVENLDVGPDYEFFIESSYLYVKPPSKDNHNSYQGLVTHTPLLAPYGQEEIWRLKDDEKTITWLVSSFGTRLKSHVFRCHNRENAIKLERFYADKLGSQGYTTKMLTKGRGVGVEYAMVLTHSTETPDACVDVMLSDGYKPFGAKTKARATKRKLPESKSDLESREKELLKELDAVRKKLNE